MVTNKPRAMTVDTVKAHSPLTTGTRPGSVLPRTGNWHSETQVASRVSLH